MPLIFAIFSATYRIVRIPFAMSFSLYVWHKCVCLFVWTNGGKILNVLPAWDFIFDFHFCFGQKEKLKLHFLTSFSLAISYTGTNSKPYSSCWCPFQRKYLNFIYHIAWAFEHLIVILFLPICTSDWAFE